MHIRGETLALFQCRRHILGRLESTYPSSMFAGSLLALLYLVTVAFGAVGPRLVPSRRVAALDQRSLWRRDIAPKESIVLNYATGRSRCPLSAGVLIHTSTC